MSEYSTEVEDYGNEGVQDRDGVDSSEDFSVIINAPEERVEPPQKLRDFEQEYRAQHQQIVDALSNILVEDKALQEFKKLEAEFKELPANKPIPPAGYSQSTDVVKALELRMAKHKDLLAKFKEEATDKGAVDALAEQVNELNKTTLDYAKQRQDYLRQEREDTDLQKTLASKCKKVNGANLKQTDPAKRWQEIMAIVAKNEKTELDFGGEGKTYISKTKDGKMHIHSIPPNAERDVEIAAANGLTSIKIDGNASPDYKARVMKAAEKHGITVRNPPSLGQETSKQWLQRYSQKVHYNDPASFKKHLSLKNADYNTQKSAHEKLIKSPNPLFRQETPKEHRQAARFLDLMANGGTPEEARVVLGLDTDLPKEKYIDQAAKMMKNLDDMLPEKDDGHKVIVYGEKNMEFQDFFKQEVFKDKGDLFDKVFEKYGGEDRLKAEESTLDSEYESRSEIDLK